MEDDPRSKPESNETARAHDEFLMNCMDACALALGVEVPDERKVIYLRFLRPKSRESIAYAFKKAVERCKFFPKLAELTEWCEEFTTTPAGIEAWNRSNEQFAENFKRKRLGAAPKEELVSVIELQNTPEWKAAMERTKLNRPPKHQSREEYENRMAMLKDQARLLQGG